jgi:hypothetical protein
MAQELAEAEKLGLPVKYVSESDITQGVNVKKYGILAKRSVGSVLLDTD